MKAHVAGIGWFQVITKGVCMTGRDLREALLQHDQLPGAVQPHPGQDQHARVRLPSRTFGCTPSARTSTKSLAARPR